MLSSRCASTFAWPLRRTKSICWQAEWEMEIHLDIFPVIKGHINILNKNQHFLVELFCYTTSQISFLDRGWRHFNHEIVCFSQVAPLVMWRWFSWRTEWPGVLSPAFQRQNMRYRKPYRPRLRIIQSSELPNFGLHDICSDANKYPTNGEQMWIEGPVWPSLVKLMWKIKNIETLPPVEDIANIC